MSEHGRNAETLRIARSPREESATQNDEAVDLRAQSDRGKAVFARLLSGKQDRVVAEEELGYEEGRMTRGKKEDIARKRLCIHDT